MQRLRRLPMSYSTQTGAIHLVPLVLIAGLGLYLMFNWPSIKTKAAYEWEMAQMNLAALTGDMQRSASGLPGDFTGGELSFGSYEDGINDPSGMLVRFTPEATGPVLRTPSRRRPHYVPAAAPDSPARYDSVCASFRTAWRSLAHQKLCPVADGMELICAFATPVCIAGAP